MDTSKRILMVSTDFPYIGQEGFNVQGGGGACIAQLVDGLTQDGYDITIVTRTEPDLVDEAYDIPIYRTGYYNLGFRESKITHYMTATKKCKELMKEKKYDLIHTHNPVAGLTGNKVARGMPHIMTMHGSWAGVRQKFYTRKLATMIERKAINGCDVLTCDSHALLSEMLSKYKPNAAVAIPNAIDVSKFSQFPQEFARQEMNLDPDTPIVLYTGRFVAEKGLPYLLEAFKDVQGARLLMVGGGFDEHLVKKWIVANPEQASRMNVFPYMPYEKMPLVYATSDIFVLPSLSEGLSRSVMEAMASGIPVIATDVGGNPELIEDCGILVPPKDPQALSEAINRLLKDKPERERLGKLGKQKALLKLGVSTRINKFKELYESLLK